MMHTHYLERLITSKQMNPKSFAESLGYKRADIIYNVLNGKNGLSSKLAKLITSVYNDVNYEWLISGEGEMISMEGKPLNANYAKNEDGNMIEVADSILIKMPINKEGTPYYNVDFAGGWSSEELFTHKLPEFFIYNPEFYDAEFACNLIGNSISASIPNGAIIGLKKVNDWHKYIVPNEIYGIIMKNDLRTVKIVKKSKNAGCFELIPNPLPEHNKIPYDSEDVKIDYIQNIFHVVAWEKIERIAQ